MSGLSKCLGTAWLLLVSVLFCGCAMRESGYKISDETIAFIQPGKTTRAEIVENLGQPLLDLPDIRVLAYSWGKVRATGGNAMASHEGMQNRPISGYAVEPGPYQEGGSVEARRWICCVAFDENSRATRVERIRLEGAASVEKATRDWFAGRH
ncbi:MAG: hypothetical protein U1G07_11210 [Verrucomicrobiota bacterium]